MFKDPIMSVGFVKILDRPSGFCFKKASVPITMNKAKNENIKCGYHLVEPETDQIKLLQVKGYDMIAFRVDIRMLDIGARMPFAK